jgi:hypothetical protein
MISLVDPSDLEHVLRPTVYEPRHPEPSGEGSALSAAEKQIPRFTRDDVKKSPPR